MLEQRRPDSGKGKGPGFFSKIKQAMTKNSSGPSRLSFGRKSMKSVKKVNSSKETEKTEHTLQTITEQFSKEKEVEP